MKKMIKLILVTLISTLFSACINNTPLPEIPKIDFSTEELTGQEFKIPTDQKEFKILQLADTQMYEYDDTAMYGVFTLVEKLAKTSNPDLIILTGDNTGGEDGTKILKKFITFLDTLDIPYAATLGNHDPESDEKSVLAQVYQSGKNSLFRSGPTDKIDGVGNYNINILQDDKIKYSLYLFDSNRYRKYTLAERIRSFWGGMDYDYIYPNQIAWYESSILHTNTLANTNIPSLAFFHIALPEFRAYKKAAEEDIIIEQSKKGETVGNPYANTGLFAKMKELGSTKGVFVGHDHINNYAFLYENIILCYGLKTGRTSYFDEDLQGGTLITLKDNFETVDIRHLYESEL